MHEKGKKTSKEQQQKTNQQTMEENNKEDRHSFLSLSLFLLCPEFFFWQQKCHFFFFLFLAFFFSFFLSPRTRGDHFLQFEPGRADFDPRARDELDAYICVLAELKHDIVRKRGRVLIAAEGLDDGDANRKEDKCRQ